MKIKTIEVFNDASEFDRLVNGFESQHDVRFTQTHAVNIGDGILFVAVVFYNE